MFLGTKYCYYAFTFKSTKHCFYFHVVLHSCYYCIKVRLKIRFFIWMQCTCFQYISAAVFCSVWFFYTVVTIPWRAAVSLSWMSKLTLAKEDRDNANISDVILPSLDAFILMQIVVFFKQFKKLLLWGADTSLIHCLHVICFLLNPIYFQRTDDDAWFLFCPSAVATFRNVFHKLMLQVAQEAAWQLLRSGGWLLV